MTELATTLVRPRGRYGVDGDYQLIPAPIVLAGYLLWCFAATVLAVLWLVTGRTLLGAGAAVIAVLLIATGVSVLRFSRRGKFEVWARLLTEIGLRGDERVLDLGSGRSAVLLMAAKLVPRGTAVAIHNLPDNDARRAAIDEAVRVLRPGGHVVVADLGFTRFYANRFRQCGMVDVRRQDLGWRAWWGLPFLSAHAVIGVKARPTR
jgi:arsenite methyltransferase